MKPPARPDQILPPHLISVEYTGEKTLNLSFDDGNSKLVYTSEHFIGPVFKPLQGTVEFTNAVLETELENFVWPIGADYVPEFFRDIFLTHNSKNYLLEIEVGYCFYPVAC